MFHLGTGANRLNWSEQDQKVIDPCLADFYAILKGKKPLHAKLDAEQSKDLSISNTLSSFFKGDRYSISAKKVLVRIGGVAGYLYGAEVDFDRGFAHVEPEVVALSHFAFYSSEEIQRMPLSVSQPGPATSKMFHLGTGKTKLVWPQKEQKVIGACLADSDALLRGKKPVSARLNPDKLRELNNLVSKSEWYAGDNYEIWVARTGVVIGGLTGFLYSVRLYFDPDFAQQELGPVVLSHVAFYSYDEMEKLLGNKELPGR